MWNIKQFTKPFLFLREIISSIVCKVEDADLKAAITGLRGLDFTRRFLKGECY